MPRLFQAMKMSTSHIVIAGHSASEDARERAYDPAIHRLKKVFAKRMDRPKSSLPDFGISNTQVGYIRLAWSSPRVTKTGTHDQQRVHHD
jgi:hypothetical protein